jgi:hypothetical protein
VEGSVICEWGVLWIYVQNGVKNSNGAYGAFIIKVNVGGRGFVDVE